MGRRAHWGPVGRGERDARWPARRGTGARLCFHGRSFNGLQELRLHECSQVIEHE